MLGLATGSICLMTCTPIYLPYLLSEDRSLIKGIGVVAEISIGRFFSYIAFGAAAGFIGSNISSINRTIFTSIAYILLSIYLILSAVRTRQKENKCHVPKLTKLTRSAIILGILTGINFCPSFLIALSKAINLGGAVSGMLLFFGFFVGTTLYLIPIAFVGQLSRIKYVKLIGQIASILVAIWFIFTGIKGLVQIRSQVTHVHDEGETRYVDVFYPSQHLTIIAQAEHAQYFSDLRDTLQMSTNKTVPILIYTSDSIDSLARTDSVTLFVDLSLRNDANLHPILHNFDVFYVEPGYSVGRMVNFLNKFTFRTSETLQWEFKEK